MGRKYKFKWIKINPDPIYKDVNVARFINKVMLCGKKTIAEKICYSAISKASEKCNEEPNKFFKMILSNIAPKVEVRSRRIGGTVYRIPVDIKPRRQSFLSMKWLVQCARIRPEKKMVDRLFLEMVDVYNKTGRSIKKRDEVYKMAEANKMFAHFKY